ncbi:MAG: isoleucine--tRNA ligase, partial [Planctomycetes bacterium]|nr:isoleucine--tRNA ligase [Planctomycetota bacterium]
AREGQEKYVLHDGPPYPTGELHVGTGLNKVLKDFFVRFHNMKGYDAPYVPGWDCHGLPIEVKVLEELGEGRENTPRSEIRARCRDYALTYVDVQKQQFRSLGIDGDWDNPYLTLNHQYEQGTLEVFAEMVGNGFIYRDLKPVHWCHHCRTVLAEAELEYEDVSGPSIFVNFPVLRHAEKGAAVDPWKLFDLKGEDTVHILIWTTTPWTLPANLAVAVHPRADYVAARYEHPRTGEKIVSILAKGPTDSVLRGAGVEDYELLGRVKGDDLVGMEYRHPFIDRECPVVPAQYVTLEDGTGCVHTAPGHGLEDYVTGINHGLDILSPVDERGYFTEEAGPFAGQHIVEGDRTIVEHLVEEGYMLQWGEDTHSYPHCWRCHEPVIFRATNQWFVRIDHEDFRESVLETVGNVDWVPAWGEKRMKSMVSERPDWCISRQKSWGVPIPAFYCEGCGEVLLTRESVLHVGEVFAERGADSWFEIDDVHPFLPEGTSCPKCGGQNWRKEKDIFDVWFESGSSHHSVCRKRPELKFPVDLYLEGTDQYRGWFQLSLLPSMAAWQSPPYDTVLTHGFVVDEEGRKMSKSAGNFISVEEAVEDFHAEVLRLWMLSVDYRDTISVSADYIRKNMVDAYRRIRNTFRFLLGNLSDFNPETDALPTDELREMDCWALDETARLIEDITDAWESYDLHRVYTLLHNFCAVQMSSTYFDALKDRLYCAGKNWPERRSAQTALHHVLLTLTRLCAPVLVHTAEEVWAHIEHKDEDLESVHLASWPQVPNSWLDGQLHERWTRILNVRDDVSRAIEELREGKDVSNSMEVSVELWTDSNTLSEIFDQYADTVQELLLLSELEIIEGDSEPQKAEPMVAGEKETSLRISTTPSEYAKCERCWNLRPSVGENSDWPDLCERCVKAVEETGFSPESD